ncbi:PREDICTED: putative FBD-associated F-box protein At5g56390 [Camelina sativa]|uniref:FBD-associated F-box protein At5g56390 n=1 Tax=Camelina sativa TaxID=90675 RepID=A0ABM0WV20_CAMSA|nr:PREDICTED: putative FBD-associated F-box protein At5g56390 [Camelina sativa]
MDRLSHLHDELLLDILSLLPSAKDVVATMVLSKRWRFLWRMVPTLVYDDSYQNTDKKRFSTFVDRSMVLHKAPVLDTLHFKLGKIFGTGYTLARAADYKSCVRKLVIEIDTSPSSSQPPVMVPWNLYSGVCNMLATLILHNVVLMEFPATPVSFPSLKKLKLKFVKFAGSKAVSKLLSSCPVLEDLGLKECSGATIWSVRVPSLKRLSLLEKVNNVLHEFVIDAPSLESLKIVDYSLGSRIAESNMSRIITASVDLFTPQTEQLMGSLTSAKSLFLCLPNSKDAYPVGRIFRSLVHLTICTCETDWLNVLIRVLRDSPNLKTLKIQQYHAFRDGEPRPCWKETSLVPEYLLPSLETFEWVKYLGTETEKEVVAFILRIASCLKQATIKSSKPVDHDKKLEMLKDFPVSSRRSPACLLAFSWSVIS